MPWSFGRLCRILPSQHDACDQTGMSRHAETQRRNPDVSALGVRHRGAAGASRRAVLGQEGSRRLVDPERRICRERGCACRGDARVRGGNRRAAAWRLPCRSASSFSPAARSSPRGRSKAISTSRPCKSNLFELEWPPKSGRKAILSRSRPRGMVLARRRAAQDSARAVPLHRSAAGRRRASGRGSRALRLDAASAATRRPATWRRAAGGTCSVSRRTAARPVRAAPATCAPFARRSRAQAASASVPAADAARSGSRA